MKKRLIIFSVIIITAVIAISLIFVLTDRKNNIAPSRETEASQSQSADSSGLRVTTENDFVVTDKTNEGVELSLKADIREPFILEVPETFKNEKVCYFSGIESSPYVREINIPDGVSCGMVSDCSELQKIHYGSVGSEQIIQNDDSSVDFDAHEGYGSIGNCPKVSELTFSEGEGYVQITLWGQLTSLKNVSLPEKTLRMSLCFVEGSGISQSVLPGELLVLDSSFLTAHSLTYVRCNEKLEKISFSFIACNSLQFVVIPSKTTKIESSFSGCPNLTLVVEKDSLAEEYAREEEIDYIYSDQFDPGVVDTLEEIPTETDETDSNLSQEGIFTDDEVAEAVHISSEEYFTEVKGYFVGDYIEKNDLVLEYTGEVDVPFVLEIPETYDGRTVNAFVEIEKNPYICEIIYPDTVKYCGHIKDCKNLRSVTFGSDVVSIYDCPMLTSVTCINNKSDTFPGPNGTPKLEHVTIPDNIEILSGFEKCGIKTLEIPDSVREIWFCFWDCPNIEEIVIPDGVTFIFHSFERCQNLKKVYIPASVTNIDSGCFSDCPQLEFVVERYSEAEYYAKRNNIPYSYVQETEEED